MTRSGLCSSALCLEVFDHPLILVACFAQLLDMPIGTIKGRMRLGLEKMRRTLEAAGVVAA